MQADETRREVEQGLEVTESICADRIARLLDDKGLDNSVPVSPPAGEPNFKAWPWRVIDRKGPSNAP